LAPNVPSKKPKDEVTPMPEATLYERLGGAFSIAAVVDHFSDAVVKNPIVGQRSENPALREWHTKNLGTSGSQIHAHAVGM
jgi:hemoglobin